MHGISGAWNHVRDRGIERLGTKERQLISRALYKVGTLIKNRKVPNGKWYRRVHHNGRTIGYICGFGCNVTTVLSGNMVPHGSQV